MGYTVDIGTKVLAPAGQATCNHKMSESDLLNFTGHLARQTLSGSSRPTSFLDSGLDKRGKSSILSKLTALNLAADTRRLTGCSQVFEAILALVNKAALRYTTRRFPGLRRPCASHLVTPRLEPTHSDKANKACQKKEPAVSLSDRSGGDGSGPRRPPVGPSGHGNKARRMLGKRQRRCHPPRARQRLAYSRRQRKDSYLARAKPPGASRTK